MTPVRQRRKASGQQRLMFLRMIWRGALVRRGRTLTALLAVAVAAAVTSALLNLYVDAQAKLRSEFRNYGANIVVIAKDGASLPPDALGRVQQALGAGALAVPVGYAVARSGNESVVVVGTDLPTDKRMNQWWSVTPLGVTSMRVLRRDGLSADAETHATVVNALIGVRAEKAFLPNRATLSGAASFDLTFRGRTVTVLPTAALKTGAAEDSRIYLDLPEFTKWTGVQPSTIEVAVSGSTDEVNTALQQLQRALPEAEVRPVRQIMETEARVLGKTRAALLGSTAMVIVTAALCVFATLMTWVLDRRRDFAVMKALGASEGILKAFFAAEAGLLGVLGAALGFCVGIGVAAWIGRVNFHAPVTPRFSVLPAVLVGGVAVALLAALAPISLLRRIQPAAMLRGE
jgi:putative ABC transport system permease protein